MLVENTMQKRADWFDEIFLNDSKFPFLLVIDSTDFTWKINEGRYSKYLYCISTFIFTKKDTNWNVLQSCQFPLQFEKFCQWNSMNSKNILLLWNFSWNWSGGKCPILGQVLPLKDIKYIDLPPCPCVENNPVVSTKLISFILQWNFYEFNFRVQLWTFVLLVWVVRQELY